jgi:hypothetical protein
MSDLETVRTTLDRAGVPEWDSPLRTRRIDYETRKEITSEDWNKYEWYNCTSRSDPPDAHVYARTWEKRK